MIKLANIATLAGLLTVAGCAGLVRQFPVPGDSGDAVLAKMGRPTAVYPQAAGGQQLEFGTAPMGQYTWMAHIGPDGKLAAFEQVLTGEKFATIKIDQATRDDVLRTIGHPAERSTLPLRDLEVWSYRYKESGVWNSMMHVHFDRNGVVRQMLNGPDRMYDDRERFRW